MELGKRWTYDRCVSFPNHSCWFAYHQLCKSQSRGARGVMHSRSHGKTGTINFAVHRRGEWLYSSGIVGARRAYPSHCFAEDTLCAKTVQEGELNLNTLSCFYSLVIRMFNMFHVSHVVSLCHYSFRCTPAGENKLKGHWFMMQKSYSFTL